MKNSWIYCSLMINLLAVSQAIPQDSQWRSPFAKPPESTILVDEQFESELPSSFKTINQARKVKWESGVLTFPDQSGFDLELKAAGYVEVQLDIRFPELTDEEPAFGLKVGLELYGASDSFVWFRQKRDGKGVRSAVFIADRWNSPKPIGAPLKLDGGLPSGQWKLVFRFGLWSVHAPGQEPMVLSRYSNPDHAAPVVQQLRVRNEGPACQIKSVSLAGFPQKYLDVEDHPEAVQVVDQSFKDYKSSTKLLQQGKFLDAISLMEESVAKLSNTLGEYHPNAIIFNGNLGYLMSRIGRNDEALELSSDCLRRQIKLVGSNHPDIAITYRRISQIKGVMGDLEGGLRAIKKSVELLTPVLGKDHPQMTNYYADLATAMAFIGQIKKAEKLYFELWETLGQNDRMSDDDLVIGVNLASLYLQTGQVEKSAVLIEEIIAASAVVNSNNRHRHAEALFVAAKIASRRSEYQKAIDILERCKKIFAATSGIRSRSYLQVLNDLAVAHAGSGDREEAIKVLIHCIQTLKRTVGEFHPEYANSLGNLGSLYLEIGLLNEAEKYLTQSARIQQALFGNDHIQYAGILSSLAALQFSKKQYETAIETLNTCIRIQLRYQAPDSREIAELQMKLVDNMTALGDFERAHPILKSANETIGKSYGAESYRFALGLIKLGRLHRAAGEFEKSEAAFQQCSKLTLGLVRDLSRKSTETEQRFLMASSYRAIGNYLFAALKNGTDSKTAYQECLPWKGLIVERKKNLRKVAAESQSNLILGKLLNLNTEIQRLVESTPESPSNLTATKSKKVYELQIRNWRNEINRLQAKRKELEQTLAQSNEKSFQFESNVKVAEIAGAIPEDGLFVDFFRIPVDIPDKSADIPDKSAAGGFQKRFFYAAFVVDNRGQVHLVDLGDADRIDESIKKWRSGIEKGIPVEQLQSLGNQVKKLCWQPLESLLNGREHILVAPDGLIGALPFSALPHKQKGRYLIEKYKFSYVSAARFLPEIAERKTDLSKVGTALLVGDVHFGMLNQENRSQPSSQRIWPPLPGTKMEIEAIRKLLTETSGIKSTILTQKQATAEAITSAMPKHSVVHLATHGYFNRSQNDQALRAASFGGHGFGKGEPAMDVLSLSPSLESGVVLSGGVDGKPSAKLTAEEVSFLPLGHVELMVLSACQTGLGDVQVGNAMTSFQQSLQVAGVKTSITSLWKVDDVASQQLMVRFYDNLISANMTKSEALHQAQIWFLSNHTAGQLASTSRGDPIQIDPQKIIKSKSPALTQSDYRVHPRFWAAFTMSGCWK